MEPQTVSLASILCLCVSLLICFGVPVGLAIWAKVKYKKAFSFLPMLGGALAFTFSQILYRIPMLQYVLPQFAWYKALAQSPWLYAAFLAVTAGLVEEFARFVVCAIMEKRRKFPDGLSYGIGHGGIEAILLVGLGFLNSIIMAFMINGGTWDAQIASSPITRQAQLIQAGQSIMLTSPASFLTGGLERLFTVIVHIALSLVVYKGFIVGKKGLYLLLAILLHAAIDFSAALFSLGVLKIGAWAMEGIILIFAAAGLLYILRQARDWRKATPLPMEPAED